MYINTSDVMNCLDFRTEPNRSRDVRFDPKTELITGDIRTELNATQFGYRNIEPKKITFVRNLLKNNKKNNNNNNKKCLNK